MTPTRRGLLAALLLLPALAQAHGFRAGFYVGAPVYYGHYGYGYGYSYGYAPVYAPPYPVYAYPAPVAVVQPAPAAAIAPQPVSTVRYYCEAPRGLYPEVPACPSGWATVPATPPDLDPGRPAR